MCNYFLQKLSLLSLFGLLETRRCDMIKRLKMTLQGNELKGSITRKSAIPLMLSLSSKHKTRRSGDCGTYRFTV